jgi:hypothetical protein
LKDQRHSLDRGHLVLVGIPNFIGRDANTAPDTTSEARPVNLAMVWCAFPL